MLQLTALCGRLSSPLMLCTCTYTVQSFLHRVQSSTPCCFRKVHPQARSRLHLDIRCYPDFSQSRIFLSCSFVQPESHFEHRGCRLARAPKHGAFPVTNRPDASLLFTEHFPTTQKKQCRQHPHTPRTGFARILVIVPLQGFVPPAVERFPHPATSTPDISLFRDLPSPI